MGVYTQYMPEQPIAFSHKVHAGENGVDCNYCHSSARKSKHSGIPSANVCMNCHTYINEGKITETNNKAYRKINKRVRKNKRKEIRSIKKSWNYGKLSFLF